MRLLCCRLYLLTLATVVCYVLLLWCVQFVVFGLKMLYDSREMSAAYVLQQPWTWCLIAA